MAKILAIVAAALLVCAVALATLGPEEMTLADAFAALDKLRFAAVERYIRLHVSNWLWEHPLRSLLLRPVWLVPAALGLISAGAAATVATSGTPLNSRRRRS